MKSKILVFVQLINLYVRFVNGYVNFETPNQALDQSLYEDALNYELCADQIRAIRMDPPLTMNFADAGIRIPKGILQGNTLDMGNYHQCLAINQQLLNSQLQGKYCVISVPLDQNLQIPQLIEMFQYPDNSNNDPRLFRFDIETIKSLEEYYVLKKGMMGYTGMIDVDRVAPDSPFSALQLTLAVCIPKPCTTRQAIDSFLFNISEAGFKYSDAYCRLPNDKPRRLGDYVGIAIFSLLGLITLLSTSYDLWNTFVKKTDPKALSVIGKSFSVYTNGRRLMTFNSGPDTIECLDGIRALAMAWVLLGHSFTNEISWSNPLDALTWSRSWQVLWVSAAHYTVDTFFTLSGFLVIYTTVGKLTGKSLLKNLHLFYLNRLLRMFPLLAAAVLLEATFLNRMTDGPNWTVVASQVNNCRATWWSTLLHIQNYMSPEQMCMIQGWYLAIDVQLHILSPIILVWVLWGNKKIAWTALSFGCLSAVTAAAIYIFIKQFPPVMMAVGREHEMRDYVNLYYINTLTRAPPFFVGMFFGYIVRMTKIKPKGVRVIAFWISFFTFSTFLVYFTHLVSQPTWDNQFMSSFYNAFFRVFWGIVVGSLIYACVNGFAGPINWFLSLQVWKIHSRLSYGMYVFHYMLMSAVNYTAVTPFFFTPGAVTYKFLGHYSFTMAVSFVMILTIDAPFSTLFKVLLGGGIKKPVKEDEDNLNEPAEKSDKRV